MMSHRSIQGILGLAAVALFTVQAWGGVPVSGPRSNAKEPELAVYRREALHRAVTLAQAGNRAGAAAVIAEAAGRVGAGDPFIDELQGTVAVVEKDYRAAMESFHAETVKAPDSPVAWFNFGEALFLLGQYQAAEHAFSLVELQRHAGDPATADLCRFKRVICDLSLGAIEEAEALLPKAEETPASPAVQYARAAIEHVKKSEPAAAAALAAARQEFSAEVENLYVDSFIELGWGARTEAGQFAFSAPSK
jgi:tetratricopeptide (TPR) repeat protein